MTLAKWIVVAIALVLLPGCNLLRGEDAPNETYDILAPVQNIAPGETRSQLLVKEPVTLKTLDSQQIVLKPEPRVVTYLANAQWVDTAPRLVQARLVEVFENTGRTGATARPGDGLVIDYQLVSSLRRFEIAQDRNAAVFEISIKLLNDRTGQVLETRIFTAQAPLEGTEATDYIRALDRAFDAGAREIVDWVLTLV